MEHLGAVIIDKTYHIYIYILYILHTMQHISDRHQVEVFLGTLCEDVS